MPKKSETILIDAGAVVLTLSDFNDRWNKMALGISDGDVPARPIDTSRPSGSQSTGGDRQVTEPRILERR